MTLLANPAAVARFADDNVASFPNGGGGDLCMANVRFVNHSGADTDMNAYISEGFFYDEELKTLDFTVFNNFTLTTGNEASKTMVAGTQDDQAYFCYLAEGNVVVSDMVNAELIEGKVVGVKPISVDTTSSFTVTLEA